MDEPTDAQCRKCGAVFTTSASTRTHCPACRAAVTVRRGGSLSRTGAEYNAEGEGDLVASLGALIGLVALVGWWIWRGLRGNGPSI